MYTKSLKRKYRIFSLLDLLFLIGTTAFLVITIFIRIGSGSSSENDLTLKEQVGSIIYSLGITLITLLILMIFIGYKIKKTIWMVDLILAAYLFGTTGMWAIFLIWGIDEYILSILSKFYKNKFIINKEIDKRET